VGLAVESVGANQNEEVGFLSTLLGQLTTIQDVQAEIGEPIRPPVGWSPLIIGGGGWGGGVQSGLDDLPSQRVEPAVEPLPPPERSEGGGGPKGRRGMANPWCRVRTASPTPSGSTRSLVEPPPPAYSAGGGVLRSPISGACSRAESS
jgi:hypothetical protein